MEDQPHWITIAKCILCEQIPKYGPMYQCPHRHQYCSNCTEELKKKFRGNIKNGCTCVLCKASGVFQKSKFNTEFLNKLLTKPSLERPLRFHKPRESNVNTEVCQKIEPEEEVTVEELFHLPSDKVRELLKMEPSSVRMHNSTSKVPIECPHKPCRKMVASSAFVTHFNHEHQDIPKYNTVLGKELCLPFDVSHIEYGSRYCIAMITVYEKNTIDINYSKSSRSVIKTCTKFNGKIPVNTFWLMVCGSPNAQKSDHNHHNYHLSYIYVWLFNASEDNYRCTMELSSRYDSTCFSTQCDVSVLPMKNYYGDIVENLNCLLMSKETLINILGEGPQLNLRVTVH